MAATALKSPEFKLTEKEAQLLSQRACKVASHYNIAPSEKIQDWCALIMVAGQMYYPRVMLAKMRADQERAERRAQQMGQTQAGVVI